MGLFLGSLLCSIDLCICFHASTMLNKKVNIKINTFHTAKETIKKIERQPTEWANIFADTFDKGLYLKFIKNS